jgi:outer membrane protein OmpA-like peptidoglycan-associated protein
MKNKSTLNLLICILLFLISAPAFSQNTGNLIKKGKNFLKQENPWSALPVFEDALDQSPSNQVATFYIGVCNLLLENPSHALETLESIDETSIQSEKSFHYWLGRTYFSNSNFDQATRSFELYVASGDQEFQASAQNYIQYVKNAQTLYGSPKQQVVENLGIQVNSEFQDYSALVSTDHKTIFYTSKREGNLGGTTSKGERFEDILSSTIDPAGNWSSPERFEGLSTHGHDAAVFLFSNDQKMLVYQEGDLYETDQKEDGTWTELKSLGKNINSKKYESHACVSADEQMIIFTSDNKTANGDLDMFYAVKDNSGNWGSPKAITALNTPLDEDGPYLADDGSLYFSSKGHNSIGGYDVFKSEFDADNMSWGAPENMGYPLNSVLDDNFFSIQGEIGYVTSNRPGGYGKEDIYRVYMFSDVQLAGTVINKSNQNPIPGASLKFIGKEGTLEATADAAGRFSLTVPFNTDYKVKVYEQNMVRHEESFIAKIGIDAPKEMERNFYIQLNTGDGNSSNGGSMGGTANPFKKASSETKEFLATLRPSGEAKMVVGGMVKDRRSKQPLSGEVELVDATSNEVISTTSSDARGFYKIDIIRDDLAYKVRAKSGEHLTTTRTIDLGKAVDGVVFKDLSLPKVEVGQTFVIKRIYFGFNQSVLQEVSYPSLDRVKEFLDNNPTLTVEVGGHSDSVGNKEYNEKLCRRRAQNVLEYLVKKGIERSRLVVKIYGESNPIASNDDEVGGREVNRRIELKVISN